MYVNIKGIKKLNHGIFKYSFLIIEVLTPICKK